MLDVAIIGCGVVGAAAAYELSHYPLHTAIFEAESFATALLNTFADSSLSNNESVSSLFCYFM